MRSHRILLTTFGSLGDLHPYLAIAVELRRRGHIPVIGSIEHHRSHVEAAGLEFRLIRSATFEQPDRELIRHALHLRRGPEFIIRKLLMPALRTAYADTLAAAQDATLLISHPVTFATPLVAAARGIAWASTVLAPMSLLSAYDPAAIPGAALLSALRPLGPAFFRPLFALARRAARRWTAPVDRLRSELGLPPNPDPLFAGANSPALVLALFSPLLGAPQPDWPAQTVVTGFPFYAQAGHPALPLELERFLNAGEPPVVFTLGSSAVHDAGRFYQQSAEAAQRLGRRAVLLTGGTTAKSLAGFPPAVTAFDYAPYSLLFPRAAAIVHQGGVGTTAEAMRAGRPMLVMPYSVDQPDNAARVKRLGMARVVPRTAYSAGRAARELELLLRTPDYAACAASVGEGIRSEDGAASASGAIELLLSGLG